jgi:hypothetical protein
MTDREELKILLKEIVTEHTSPLVDEFKQLNEHTRKMTLALYGDEDNQHKGVIDILHEDIKPKVETFARYLEAKAALRRTYIGIARAVGAIITIAGTLFGILSIFIKH